MNRRIGEFKEFDAKTARGSDDPRLRPLQASVSDSLDKIFGAGTTDYYRYAAAAHIDTGPIAIGYEVPLHEVRQAIADSVEQNIALLEQAVRNLTEELSEAEKAGAGASPTQRQVSGTSNKIFVVHGRQNGPREAVARFLESLSFEAVVLHEQANKGQTVIENLESNSGVGFAVVILTPDDVGGLQGGTTSPRPRQNVLLELGFFIGKLGRSHVCVLQAGDLELPSDWAGVVDEPFDEGGAWKTKLARELKGAGYSIDWNLVMT